MTAGNRLEIVGHRGARGIAPENTLAGFQIALDIGVDMIELDVHLSSDGELVVIHDPRLERTTDGNGPVSDFTLAELKKLNAAARFDGQATFGIQRIPTLQEVYDLVKGQARARPSTRINIEIKTAADGSRYPDIERRVVELVRRNDAISYTVISSFSFPTLQQVQCLEPQLAHYAIISTEYFRQTQLEGKGARDVVADMLAHGFREVAVNKQFLNPDLITQFHEAGFRITAWIIDDVEEMWRYANMGISRITTDRPDLLVPAYRSQVGGIRL